MKAPMNHPLKPLLLCLLVLTGFSLATLTGCSRATVSPGARAPEFSLADLGTGKSLLFVQPEIRITGFSKPYHSLFPDSTALAGRISRAILDSVRIALVPAVTASDSGLRALLSSTGATHVIWIKTVTIGDTVKKASETSLPEIGGSVKPVQGGVGKACVVRFEVEVHDAAGRPLYAFTVRADADVPLYAYKTALKNALDAASNKTARHLAGR